MTPTLQALTSPAQAPQSDGSEQLPLADDSFDPSSNPLVKAVSDQTVPGVLFSLADLKSPDVAPLVANSRKLPGLGLGVYTNPAKKIAALFNPAVVTADELKKVDKAGKLDKFLVPYSTFSKGSAAPPTNITNPVEGVPPPAPQTPVQPLSRGAQTANAKSRISSVVTPSKQKAPGGGMFLNSLLKG